MKNSEASVISAPDAAAGQRPEATGKGLLGRDLKHLGWMLGQWLKGDPLVGTGLLVLFLVFGVVSVVLGLQVQKNLAAMTNALAAKNAAAASGLIAPIIIAVAIVVVASVVPTFAALALRMRFRRVVTLGMLNRWFEANRFFHLERRGGADYPEQRIQEDVFFTIEQTLQKGPETVFGLLTVVLYAGTLWRVSPPITAPAIGLNHPIPGLLVYCTLGFAIVMTLVTHWIGVNLTHAEIKRQTLEARYRQQMAELRQNGETIAFTRAAGLEKLRLSETFAAICSNWRAYTLTTLAVNGVTSAPMSAMMFAPTILCAPFVLSGQMKIGDVTLVTTSVLAVYVGAGILMANYRFLALLRAAVARLRLLDEQLAAQITSQLDVAEEARGDIVTRNLKIAFPDGQPMNQIGDLTITRGERLLIQGRSGAGKSTLLRAIAGLWPFGGGAVRLPKDAKIAFLPQRPYMPDGTLASLMSYPQLPSVHDDAAYLALLKQLDLGRLAGQLHTFAPWSKALSPGEQQRIAAIRAILAAPDFLFVDEATSALDPQLEAALYALLAERLPNTALISVAHRPAVARYHTTVLKLEGGGATRSELNLSVAERGA